MQLRDMLNESFNKEYAYRIKLAADCNDEHLDMLESCLQKYNLVSVAPWKRSPIQENPQEFVRVKGAKFVSEVNSTDVVLKYPTNPRILEVWLAVNMGLPHERVLVYGINEPRRLEADLVAERSNNDGTQSESLLSQEDQSNPYYEAAHGEDAPDAALYGEEYNTKFLAELAKLKKELGEDYFRCYPSKDELMGDNLRPMWDELHNGVNMGRGAEQTKEVDVISQAARRN